MYKKRHLRDQLEFENFYLPFGGKLKADNRWVLLRELIPWSTIEKSYDKNFNSQGRAALDVQIALGSLIIKERLNLSDRETVLQISENPYLQYFIGLEEYQDKLVFDASSLVYFRKRFTLEILQEINELICYNQEPTNSKKDDESDNDEAGGDSSSNKGKLLMDATCIPADITYPTDVKLLNKAREKTEQIIDILSRDLPEKKVRTYRRVARKDFLAFIRKKNNSKATRRKSTRKQLGYLRRNLANIEALKEKSSLSLLGKNLYLDLLVINEVYRQQMQMFESKTKRIDQRIVSIHQPHIRPISRGKLHAKTEFGAKISISLIDGMAYLDRLSWNAYNESTDLVMQAEKYLKRYGYYPESIHADQIYRTKSNRQFCTDKGIRLSGPALGRPPKDESIRQAQKDICRQDEIDRIPVEGKFGQVKRGFGLSRLMTKLAGSSETVIALVFMIANLIKKLEGVYNFIICLITHRLKSIILRIHGLQQYKQHQIITTLLAD